MIFLPEFSDADAMGFDLREGEKSVSLFRARNWEIADLGAYLGIFATGMNINRIYRFHGRKKVIINNIPFRKGCGF